MEDAQEVWSVDRSSAEPGGVVWSGVGGCWRLLCDLQRGVERGSRTPGRRGRTDGRDADARRRAAKRREANAEASARNTYDFMRSVRSHPIRLVSHPSRSHSRDQRRRSRAHLVSWVRLTTHSAICQLIAHSCLVWATLLTFHCRVQNLNPCTGIMRSWTGTGLAPRSSAA